MKTQGRLSGDSNCLSKKTKFGSNREVRSFSASSACTISFFFSDIEEGCGGGKSPRLEKQDSLGCGGRRGSDSDLSRKSTGESLTPFDDGK